MKDLRQSQIALHAAVVRDKDSKRTIKASTWHEQKVDGSTIKNNPKIDRRLLAEYEHLIAASKGVIRVTQGADYNLAHPLASKDKPTDVYHRGQSVSANKTK